MPESSSPLHPPATRIATFAPYLSVGGACLQEFGWWAGLGKSLFDGQYVVVPLPIAAWLLLREPSTFFCDVNQK